MIKLISPSLSDEIRFARRRLEELPRVHLLKPIYWEESQKRWVLHCKLHLSATVNASKNVPESTEWFVLIDPTYPRGRITFYPSMKNGLHFTFRHQSLNIDYSPVRLWKAGDICLNSAIHILHRKHFDPEPSSTRERLFWHFCRALNWIDMAASNQLIKNDEPFELPPFENPLDREPLFVHIEDRHSYGEWQVCPERWGLAKIGLTQDPKIFLVHEFLNEQGAPIRTVHWNSLLMAASASETNAIWILLKDIPVIEEWHTPRNWKDLEQVLSKQNINFSQILTKMGSYLRRQHNHLVIFGLPIPENQGGLPHQLHWQAAFLPVLSPKQGSKGFRPTETSLSLRDRNVVFPSNPKIRWIRSQNWSKEQVFSRGRLGDPIESLRILLIGAGALGSLIGEHLARGGASFIAIVDGEDFAIGNIVRHTLLIPNISNSKASQLADRLMAIAPQIEVEAFSMDLENIPKQLTDDLSTFDLIIDTTGNNEVLDVLADRKWGPDVQIVSLSVGYGAERLFCFRSRGNVFNPQIFQEALAPILQEEQKMAEERGFSREGYGCWHPVFPASYDDMAILSATAIKWLRNSICSHDTVELQIFKQQGKYGSEGINSRKLI